MKQLLPPLKSLHAFEVAARHESFLEAADELAVTPGAISRHIKLLENFLETTLFERRSNGVVLTRDGKLYAEKTAAAFLDLSKATLEIKRAKQTRRLIISTLPVFSERWLNPRLPDFQKRNQGVDLQIDFHNGTTTEPMKDVDAWVYYTNGRHLIGNSTLLFPEELVPICSPEVYKQLPPNVTAERVARLPRLHDMFWDTDWQDWARSAGAAEMDLSRGMRFALYSGVIQAACSGMGVAIGHSSMVTEELADGRLVALKHLAVRSPKSYYLIMPEMTASKPIMKKLKSWFQTQVGKDPHPD